MYENEIKINTPHKFLFYRRFAFPGKTTILKFPLIPLIISIHWFDQKHNHRLAHAVMPHSLSLSSSMSNRRLRPFINCDFELRHWRPPKRRTRPSAITIPNGDATSSELSEINQVPNGNEDERYISIRDILTSPEYADVASPVTAGSWTEINITNPLVKHAAYAYLQPNASARGVETRRRVDVKRLFLEIFSPCLEFLGVIFNFRR
jgi:hypothetical protein